MRKTILVCISDAELEKQLKRLCVEAPRNHWFVWAERLGDIHDYVRSNHVDLLVVQPQKPYSDFSTLVKEFHLHSGAPVFVMVDSGDVGDLVFCLGVADDGLILPVTNEKEFIARGLALLKSPRTGGAASARDGAVLDHLGVEVDWDAQQVSVLGTIVPMTSKEIGILYYMMQNIGIVLSREIIYEKVWQEKALCGYDETVRCHIKEIRRKIRPYIQGDFIVTVTGSGYCIRKDSGSHPAPGADSIA